MKNRNPVARFFLGSTLTIAFCLTLAVCGSPTGPTPPKLPGVPQGLGIITDGNGNSTLSWTAVSEADSYKVYHSAAEAGPYLPSTSTTGTSCLLPLYGWYKVSAVNEAGEGAKSAGVERVPPGGDPKADSPRFLNESDDAEIVPGSYDEALSIKISLETGGDAIYFTTDGTVPDVGNPAYLYDGPIDVTAGQTVTITAIASGATGYSNSDAAVGTFHVRTWEVVGSAGFSGGAAYEISLTVGPSGTPAVSYRDGSAANKATVMRYGGSSWSSLGGAGISPDAAYFTSLSTDSEGSVYLAYFDADAEGRGTVRKYSGSSWTNLGVTGFTPGTFLHPSLAVHDSGIEVRPYVAFQDDSSSNKLTVMRYSGSWGLLGSAGITSGTVEFISLAVSSGGVPFVAFKDGANSDKATVLSYNGAWVSVGSAGFSAGAVSYVSLALGADGTPYVAYRDGANSGKATVMKYTGSWSSVGGAGFTDGTAEDIALAAAGDGSLYLAFTDGSQGGKASLLKWDGLSWEPVGSAGISAGTVDYVDLALDEEIGRASCRERV